jgi:hypothetical protein
LIDHLNKNRVSAKRDESFAGAFALAIQDPVSRDSRVQLISARLTKNKKSRPARKKTLLSQINAHFGKLLPKEEIEKIFNELVITKVIAVGPNDRVIYNV